MKRKILIAEDDDTSFVYLDLILRSNGFSVIRARTGDSALQLLGENDNIALVLMDMKMPGLDGYEATRIIKERFPEIPVIAQTAYALMGDREKAIESGCDDYIAKPVKREELIKMINRRLDAV